MPDIATIPECGLALRAIIDHELRTFPIRDGMVIGTDPPCDIVVPEGAARHVKLRVDGTEPWLSSADPDITLRNGSNVEVAELSLRETAMFVVGRTIFDVVPYTGAPETPAQAKEIESPVNRHACPRCRSNLVEVDLAAKFCPHCGAPLPADCPPWPIVSQEPPRPEPAFAWWMMCMPLWLRRRVARDPLFFASRTTVLAYINTLFNLGLKYETGTQTDQQIPEAMRYYKKAAQLGSVPARARLQIKEKSERDVVESKV